MNLTQLKEGSWYTFQHKRKGEFYAKLVRIVDTPDDETDPVKVEVDVWTQEGSGQERYANSFVRVGGTKQRPDFTRKLLRPSLVISIATPSSREQTRLRSLRFTPPQPEGMPVPMIVPAPALVPMPAGKPGLFRRLLRRK